MTDANETPPATETVTADELNPRDRVLWPVNGRPTEFRVTTVRPEKFGDRVVAYTLHLWAEGRGEEVANVAVDDPITRIVEAP